MGNIVAGFNDCQILTIDDITDTNKVVNCIKNAEQSLSSGITVSHLRAQASTSTSPSEILIGDFQDNTLYYGEPVQQCFMKIFLSSVKQNFNNPQSQYITLPISIPANTFYYTENVEVRQQPTSMFGMFPSFSQTSTITEERKVSYPNEEIFLDTSKSLLYEYYVYKLKIAPLSYYNVCPYFIKFLGGKINVPFENLIKFIESKSGYSMVSLRRNFQRNLYGILTDAYKRPSVTDNTTTLIYKSGEREQTKDIYGDANIRKNIQLPLYNPENFQYSFILNEGVNIVKNILVMNMYDCITFQNFLKNIILNTDNYQYHIVSLFFQIFIACYSMHLSGFNHNDLHLGNILVKKIPKTSINYYIDDIKYNFVVEYIPLIYDFDRSVIKNTSITVENDSVLPNPILIDAPNLISTNQYNNYREKIDFIRVFNESLITLEDFVEDINKIDRGDISTINKFTAKINKIFNEYNVIALSKGLTPVNVLSLENYKPHIDSIRPAINNLKDFLDRILFINPANKGKWTDRLYNSYLQEREAKSGEYFPPIDTNEFTLINPIQVIINEFFGAIQNIPYIKEGFIEEKTYICHHLMFDDTNSINKDNYTNCIRRLINLNIQSTIEAIGKREEEVILQASVNDLEQKLVLLKQEKDLSDSRNGEMIRSLQDQIERLRYDLSKCEEEKSKIILELQNKLQNVASVESQLTLLGEEKKTYSQLIESKNEVLASNERQVQTLTELNLKLDQEIKNLAEKLRKCNEQNLSYEQKIKSLEEYIISQSTSLQEEKSKNDSLVLEIQKRDIKINQIEKKLNEDQETIIRLNSQIESYNDKIFKNELTIETKDDEIKKLLITREKLIRELDSNKGNLLVSKNTVNDLSVKSQYLENEINKRDRDILKLSKQNEALTNRLQKCEESLDQLSKKHIQLEEAYNNHKIEIRKYQQQLQLKDTTITSIQTQVDQGIEEIENLRRQNRDLNELLSSVPQLRKLIEDCNTEKMQLQQLITELRLEIQGLRTQIGIQSLSSSQTFKPMGREAKRAKRIREEEETPFSSSSSSSLQMLESPKTQTGESLLGSQYFGEGEEYEEGEEY